MSLAGPWIIKVGGGAAIDLAAIAADVASLADPVIIVHGANALRASLAEQLGRQVRVLTSASGYTSVHSDDEAIETMMLAYSGLQNKRLVEQLQMAGCNAIGLTGLDGRLIQGRRNSGIRVREGERTLLVRDRSGKPFTVNASLLRTLLDTGYTPVVTMPIADESGAAINSENDDVVAVMAQAIAARGVVQLIEAAGLLRHAGDDTTVVPSLSLGALQAWEAAADGRFRRKLRSLCRLVKANPSRRVIVADGRVPKPVSAALAGSGTLLGGVEAAGG